MRRGTGRELAVIAAIGIFLLCGWLFWKPAPPPGEEHLRAALLAARSELEWPGFDVKAAARALGTRERAIAFVKDEVASASYVGAWQGAEGTLRTRVANAADRAVLLAALLRELGLEVRLARGEWPEYEHPYEPRPPAREIDALARLRALVPEKVRGAVAPVDTRALAAEVSAATERLAPLVEKTWPQLAKAPALRREDWVWVQVKKGNGWEEVDVVFPDAKRPAVVRAPWEPARTRVAFDVETVDSEERRHSVVRWEGASSSVIGRDVALTLLPGTCRLDELEKLDSPERVKLWVPCLAVAGELVANGAFSREGVVLHERGGAISLEGASAPLVTREPAKEAAASALEAVELVAVDTRHFPRVHAQVRVKPSSKLAWRADEIAAADEKGALPVLVESAHEARRPVILLLDVSESMRDEDRLVLAKKALRALVERLEPDQPVALLAFSSFARVVSPLAPARACKEELLRKLDALEPSPSTALLKATEQALAVTEEAATIVLFTDGEDSGKHEEGYAARVEKLLGALRASRSAVLPIGIGEADDLLLARMAREKAAPFLRIASPRDLPRIADALAAIGGELVGGLRFSFVARGGAPGEERVVKVRLAGSSQDVLVKFTIPAVAEDASSRRLPLERVELAVTLEEEGAESRRLVHTVARLTGGAEDSWRLLVAEHVALAVGASPARTLLARRVDDALDLLAVSRLGAQSERPEETGSARGVATRTGLLAARGLARIRALASGTPVRGAGPFVFVERARWEPRGDEIARRTDLDFLAPPLVASEDATPRQRLALGLALGTVEASLLGGRSVNAQLTEATDLGATERDGALVVTSGSRPGLAWKVARSGDARVLLDDAKGASAEEAARKINAVRAILRQLGALGSTGLSKGGVPFGSVFNALCAYFDQLMKYWCYSSVMLGLVSEGIEAGKFDAKAAEQEAAKLCDLPGGMKGMGKKLVAAASGGFLAGALEDTWGASVADGIKEVDKNSNYAGAASGEASYHDPFAPKFGKAIEDAIDYVATKDGP